MRVRALPNRDFYLGPPPPVLLSRTHTPRHRRFFCATTPMSAFASIQVVPEDAIFALNTRFKADTFPQRMNLGVGAYKGSDGNPYVFDVVKQAEREIFADLESNRTNHEYFPIRGFDDFTTAAAELLYGSDSPAIKENRVACVQGISGTGSIRLGAELLWGQARGMGLHPDVGQPSGHLRGDGLDRAQVHLLLRQVAGC